MWPLSLWSVLYLEAPEDAFSRHDWQVERHTDILLSPIMQFGSILWKKTNKLDQVIQENMRWKHTECCIGIEHWNVLSLCAVIYESKVKICRHTTSHLYSCAKFLADCQFVECKVLCSNCVCQICVKIRDGNWLECKRAVHAKFSTARSC